MAVRYDGVDDVLELAAETTVRYEYTQAFSGHAWVRKFDVTGNCIMGKAQNSPPAAQQRGWAFNTENVGGILGISFHLVNNGSSAHMFAQAEAPSGTTLVTGLWTPVGFTYDGSGLSSGVTLYINGKSVSFTGTPIDTLGGGTILVNGTPVRLGGFDTEFWHGDSCGIVIVPGELTATEMAALADIRNINTDPSTFLTTANPDVWLPLRNDGGSIDLTDYSGNNHDASVSNGAPAMLADPTVVLDTFTTLDFTGDDSTTLTPNGNVAAVAVLVVQNGNASDLITGITHGGDALTRIATDGFAQDTAGETGAAYAYLKASGVQQGAQTVAIDVTSGTDAKRAFICALNAVGAIAITDSDRVQGDTANPSVTLGTGSDWAGIALNVTFSGQNAPGSLTQPSGWTKLGGGRDFGLQSGVAAIANLEGANITSGWTATSDDVAMIAFAITLTPVLSAQPASYAISGTAATLVAGRVVSSDAGSYAVTGQAATVVADYVVSADPGSYAVTGAAATPAAGLVFSADPASYVVTGEAATIVPGYAALADPGSFAVSGVAADLVYTPTGAFALDAQPGTYAVSGTAATTVGGFAVDSSPGTYAVTGSDASLVLETPGAFVLDAGTGVFAVTGANATTLADRIFPADPGSYAVTGTAATLFTEHGINAATGTFAVTGAAAGLLGDLVVNASTGTYAVTGSPAGLGSIFDSEIDAAPGAFVVSGTASTLVFAPGLVRETTRGGRIRWNTVGRITQTKEGAVT